MIDGKIKLNEIRRKIFKGNLKILPTETTIPDNQLKWYGYVSSRTAGETDVRCTKL